MGAPPVAATLGPCSAGCPQLLGTPWGLDGGCVPKKGPGLGIVASLRWHKPKAPLLPMHPQKAGVTFSPVPKVLPS